MIVVTAQPIVNSLNYIDQFISFQHTPWRYLHVVMSVDDQGYIDFEVTKDYPDKRQKDPTWLRLGYKAERIFRNAYMGLEQGKIKNFNQAVRNVQNELETMLRYNHFDTMYSKYNPYYM